MKLSIVSTLYQSGPYLAEFFKRASAAASKLVGDDYEIVLVNDGSPDNSGALAVELTKSDRHVVMIDLSRNFGHHKAMLTGLAHSRGDLVYMIDSDLEEDPAWLIRFSEELTSLRCDVVYGVQERRRGSAFKRFSGALFYRLFRILTGLNLPDNLMMARLMTRRYVDALLRYDEREVFMAGLWMLAGFDQRPIALTRQAKKTSTYTLRRRVSQFVDSVTSFSAKPLVLIFVVGCMISILALGFTVYLFVKWLVLARAPAGWTSVMASVWLLGGFITASIGVIGIYLSKVFSEAKGRPSTIVRQVYGRGGSEESQ